MPLLERTLVPEAEALMTADLPRLAADVVQSVLLLLGSESPPWAAAVTRKLAGALRAATVAVLHHEGHEAVDTAPGPVAEQLDRFHRGQ